MAQTYLDDIVTHHRVRAERDSREWRDRLDAIRYSGLSLKSALMATQSSNVKVIAEIKRRSPSKGWIDEHLDARLLAAAYQRAGAAAISVLTDETHFGGSLLDFEVVSQSVTLPLLRKDFTVSANDVLDTAAMGASAVLLIVAALSDEELRLFLEIAHTCNLDALVEVHDREEAKRALYVGATMIGVNQRDLRTFEIDANRAASVVTVLSGHAVTIAESGLVTANDVRRASEAGFDAVLVGETFVRSLDPEVTVRSFSTVPLLNRA